MTIIPILEQAEAPIAPLIHPETAPFWKRLELGVFTVQVCADCGTRRFPPAPVCAGCLSTAFTYAELDEIAGTVVSAISVVRATGGAEWAALVPYRVGMVELPDSLRMPGRIMCACGLADQPGTPVRMCRIRADGGTYVWAFTHQCEQEA